MNAATETKRPSVLKWLPGVVISLIAIFLLAKIVNWQQVGQIIKTISPVYIIVVILLTVLFILVRAIGWRVLLNEKVTLKEAFLTISIGYLANNILPFRAGEVARAFVIGQRSRLGAFNVLSTIVIERMFDLAFAAMWLLMTLPLALEMAWAKTVAIVTLVVIVAGFAAIYLAARNEARIEGWLNKFSRKLPWFGRVVQPLLLSILHGLQIVTDLRRFLTSLFFVGLSWVVAPVAYWTVLRGFLPAVPFWWGAFVNSMLAMGIALPAAPASLGVFEGAIVGALSLLKVNSNTALAYGILMHVMQILTTGVLGAIGLAFFGTSLRNLFSKAVVDKEGAK